MTLLALLAGCGRDAPVRPHSEPVENTASPASAYPEAHAFPFRDITAATGIDFIHDKGATKDRHFPETMAPGVALFDADGDSDLDLYAVNGGALVATADSARPPNRLYLNRGDGRFVDATDASGVGDSGYGMGTAVGDYDGDGRPDLYVLNYGPNALYRNLGEGRFAKVDVGVDDPLWSVGGAFLDFDRDGDLDLYVVNYLDYDAGRETPCKAGTLTIYCSPEIFSPARDRLYRNDGGRFTDVSESAGILADGRGMGLAVGDIEGDGYPDLYITNDRSRNHLYWNRNGVLSEGGTEAGVGYSMAGQVEGGMAAVIGDLTGDGRQSIFATNFQKEPNRLYTYAGEGFFDDATYPSGLGFPSNEKVSFGMAALDVEGDGDLDLAVANGHVYDNAEQFIRGSSFAMSDQLFLNKGHGEFETLEFPGAPLSSRGVASGDIDGDGDRDLVIASSGDRLRVWRNDAGTPRRFVVLKLRAADPNSSAHGARVVARLNGRFLLRESHGGGSYASHSDTGVHLGLGDEATIGHLEIRWPDGSMEATRDVAGGQCLHWRQGEGIVSRHSLVSVEVSD
ncbi:MAG: CRTAC1 family protein [bacterium]|nr:CRTAC1 family protein [bacterium]